MSTSYKRLSFTNEEEENLIEFIKQHPALWDSSHSEYGNGELRKIYWTSIATELNKSVLECRRKWRFIRDYYIHKRRRITDSTPHKDGKYFSLHFLDKVSVRRFAQPNKSSANLHFRQPSRLLKVENDFEDSEREYTLSPDVTFEKVTMERVDQAHNFLLDDEESTANQGQDENDKAAIDVISNEDFYFDEGSCHEITIEHKLSDENEEEHLVESRYEPETSKQTQQADASMHDKAIDLFFESMAAAVKTFPPQFVAEAKFKVFTAINELEMKVHSGVNGK